METYMSKGIKEIINQFPEVGEILDEFGIGCVSCTVGICELKDILTIHAMAPEQEQQLMARIEAAIYPERQAMVTKNQASEKQTAEAHVFSRPMQILVDEHSLIKRWLALIPVLIDNVDPTSKEGRGIYRQGVDFITSYADSLHHGKEEDILFSHFDDSQTIFRVIYEDHAAARNHVKEMKSAIEREDIQSLHEHLRGYAALLTEHIDKEDEILFPWLDREMSPEQVEQLAEEFRRSDRQLAIKEDRYRLFVEELEERFKVSLAT